MITLKNREKNKERAFEYIESNEAYDLERKQRLKMFVEKIYNGEIKLEEDKDKFFEIII